METDVDPDQILDQNHPESCHIVILSKLLSLKTNHKSINTRSLNFPYNGPIKSENDKSSGVRFLFEFDSSQSLPADRSIQTNRRIYYFMGLRCVTRGAAWIIWIFTK